MAGREVKRGIMTIQLKHLGLPLRKIVELARAASGEDARTHLRKHRHRETLCGEKVNPLVPTFPEGEEVVITCNNCLIELSKNMVRIMEGHFFFNC